jgi:hypothetical protein
LQPAHEFIAEEEIEALPQMAHSKKDKDDAAGNVKGNHVSAVLVISIRSDSDQTR